MNLISIPALQDNYIWVLSDENKDCLIVDPGEAAPVLSAIAQNKWNPKVILLTHHHHDHVGGVAELVRHFPDITVYGPQETAYKGAKIIVEEGDKVSFSHLEFAIFHTPGHTLGHISYFSLPYLFCGDTLFSGGCGRLFEGTAKQMFDSFQKLNKLPDETLVCCAHEYTLSNLTFCHAILPQDRDIEEYYLKIKELRENNGVSLPSNLRLERNINVFLRTQSTDLKENLGMSSPTVEEWEVFAALREKKDRF